VSREICPTPLVESIMTPILQYPCPSHDICILFPILGGGSLGPEAPLVAICGALGGFVSRKIFRQKYVNVVRKHTLMGMGGALAAFFGAPLGGSLFALEVLCSQFGIEYFEHLIESKFPSRIPSFVRGFLCCYTRRSCAPHIVLG
jgi:H+/Cl- antiporter ClcA